MNHRSQLSVHVDGAFLIKQLERASGQNRIDPIAFRQALLDYVKDRWGLRVLRIYWYGSPDINGDTGSLNESISFLDDFKMRLGSVGYAETENGEMYLRQKGVDGLLIADMIRLAQNNSVTDMLLVAGDADFVPAVDVAQELGVRVHLACPKDVNGSLARNLKIGVDTLDFWENEFLQSFLTEKPQGSGFAKIIHLPERNDSPAQLAPPREPEVNPEDAMLQGIAATFCAELDPADLHEVCGETIPFPLDRRLLTLASRKVGQTNLPTLLKNSLRRHVRKIAKGMVFRSPEGESTASA